MEENNSIYKSRRVIKPKKQSLIWKIRQRCRFWQPILALVGAMIGIAIHIWRPVAGFVSWVIEILSHLGIGT